MKEQQRICVVNAEVNDYANQASEENMTYGKKQTKEYIGYTKIGKIPYGYRKAGDKINVKRETPSNICVTD